MSQNRLRDYKEPILSFEHNIFNFGLHAAGRYAGFDTLAPTGGLTFDITHDSTGVVWKNQTFDEIGPIGVLMTPQGMLVHESESISPLSVDTNAGNNQVRYDLLVFNHQYTAVTGGADGTYSIIKGTIGSPVKPVLTDPLLQTAVGTIEIPANATDSNTFIWHKAKCPDSGDGEDARLYTPNMFQAYQGLNKSAGVNAVTNTLATGSHVANLWTLPNDGSQFVMNPAHTYIDGIFIKDIPLQEGMRVYLLMDDSQIMRESRYFEADSSLYGKGYRGFTINPGLGNYVIVPSQNGGGSAFGIKPATGETWEIEAVLVGNRWFVASINGAGSSSFQKGMIVEWFGDVAVNFDAEGKGINLMSGWQICNGNYGSPDRRGLGTVMATNVPAAGQPSRIDDADVISQAGDPEDYIFGDYYDTQGKRKFLIDMQNLPNALLDVFDPGHRHFVVHGSSGDGTPSNLNTIRTQTETFGESDYLLRAVNLDANQGRSSLTATGITVTLQGSDERLEHIAPVFMTILIIKL